MGKELKSLVKDTALYGISSIVGRFLNYLLVPLYTIKITAESGGYGVVTNVYAYTALLLVLLTFGMETTLFRFSTKEGEEPRKVYGTVLWLVTLVAVAFAVLTLVFNAPLSALMGYADHPEYIACMTTIVAIDAVQSIMFAHLRQQGRAVKFVTLKMSFIVMSISLNLFIFLAAPVLHASHTEWMGWYDPEYSVGYIFIINLICTASVTLGFIPELRGLAYGFDRYLARRMVRYAMPILVLGIFFSSFYFIFSNIEFVYERTKLVFPITLLGAGLNIVLNYIFIPKMGYGAAAYTTLISYIVVALCHYFATLRIIKRNAYPMGAICLYLGVLIGATLLMPLIYQIHFLLRYLIVLLAVAALGVVLLRGRRPAGNKNGGNDEATDL